MNDASNENSASGVVTNRTMNMVVAGIMMAVALVVMIASYRLGAGWSKDVGPDSGYFPFYVALFMFISSAVTLTQYALRPPAKAGNAFIHHHQLMMVLKVLIPMTIFVVLSIYIGIYISMILFIGFFMTWLGKYPLIKTIPIVVVVPVVLFIVFEIWFLVPLPKGPIEAWFGY